MVFFNPIVQKFERPLANIFGSRCPYGNQERSSSRKIRFHISPFLTDRIIDRVSAYLKNRNNIPVAITTSPLDNNRYVGLIELKKNHLPISNTKLKCSWSSLLFHPRAIRHIRTYIWRDERTTRRYLLRRKPGHALTAKLDVHLMQSDRRHPTPYEEHRGLLTSAIKSYAQ